MSAREILKREIDFMPDDVVSAIITICGINPENGECPICKAHDHQFGEKTTAKIEEAYDSGFVEYDSFEDFLKAVEEMDDEDEEG
jgi:hypothetical protein